MILALAFGKPKQSKERGAGGPDARLRHLLRPGRPTGRPGQGSLGDSARHAAERALASNSTLEAQIAARLDAAGMALKPAEWLLIHSGVAVASALLGLLLGRGSIVLALIFLAVGIVAPWLYLGHKKSQAPQGVRLRPGRHAPADVRQPLRRPLPRPVRRHHRPRGRRADHQRVQAGDRGEPPRRAAGGLPGAGRRADAEPRLRMGRDGHQDPARGRRQPGRAAAHGGRARCASGSSCAGTSGRSPRRAGSRRTSWAACRRCSCSTSP